MPYKYTKYLDDLKDLKHIEWYVCHSDEYEFHSQESMEALERLRNNITKKNVFYSAIVEDYDYLVKHFDNDPYNYAFDIEQKEQQEVKSSFYQNYFIKVRDVEGRWNHVPYGYVQEHPEKYFPSFVEDLFNTEMKEHQLNALNNFRAVEECYSAYLKEGGVADALKRFEGIRNGKDYHLIRKSIFYLLYNMLLLILLTEIGFFQMLTHFWQFWSDKLSAVYSSFPDIFLRTLVGLSVIYFIVMDVCYTYGIGYLIYIKGKYQMVVKYHAGVQELLEKFRQDYTLCNQGITQEIIQKVGHRDSVYLPLIQKTRRRYNFYLERTVMTGEGEDRKMKKETRIQPLYVPWMSFYKRPIWSSIILIWIVLFFAHAIYDYAYLMIY